MTSLYTSNFIYLSQYTPFILFLITDSANLPIILLRIFFKFFFKFLFFYPSWDFEIVFYASAQFQYDPVNAVFLASEVKEKKGINIFDTVIL